MTSPAFIDFYSGAKTAVSDFLARSLEQIEAPSVLHSAMNYAALDGGKLLRPTLVLAAVGDSGGEEATALPLAAAFELVHVYSLVHDDLPAMDNDDYRRGKPSCHKKYGEAIAILAGNSLLSLAFELALQARPADGALAAARILARASGAPGICAGQSMDLGLEGALGSVENILTCYRLKTGVLFAACATAGAVLVRPERPLLEALDRFGWCLGEAFQIFDDLAESKVESHSLLSVMDRHSAQAMARTRMEEARAWLPPEYVRLRELTLYVEEWTAKSQT